MTAETLLARYEAGEFESVWNEIRSNRLVDGALEDNVLEVAEATMRRVAHNADLLANRLRAQGWKALSADYVDLRTRPSPQDGSFFTQVEEDSGAPVPPTLLAFWKVVGGINWVWDYDSGEVVPNLGISVPMDEMDPLCVYPPCFMTDLIEEWHAQTSDPESDFAEPLEIDLAPDYLHKANISGGRPYAIEVPFRGADPVFAHEKHELPFLDYLRLAFRWVGFPGLEDRAHRSDVQRFVAKFGAGLMPF